MSTPPKSELGINPELLPPEAKLVQNMTREDMQKIAEITGGKLNDKSKVYDFEIGVVAFKVKNNYAYLTLRKGCPDKDNLVLWLQSGKIGSDHIFHVFSSQHEVVMGENSVMIHEPNENYSPVITIKPSEISFEIPFS